MKTCTKCLIEKPESDYFVKNKVTGRIHAQCKICYKIHRTTYYTMHYAKYGDLYRKRANLRRKRIRGEIHHNILSYLRTHPCVVCGEKDLRVLDFDHLQRSQKSFNIAAGINRIYEWKRILLEISKCRVLCANCHRKHTAEQMGWYRNNK